MWKEELYHPYYAGIVFMAAVILSILKYELCDDNLPN